MAESACLRRSFSNPSATSHEFSEGDPLRALGESISFGRYMSETLAWEKWSTFSHNRYLEEAEKSSKPGSVAKMKAYFEDHYRKIGAKKQAVLEQANNESNYVEPEVEDTHNVELVSSSNSPALNPESALPNNHSTAHEFPKKDIPNVEPLLSVIVSSSNTSTKESHNEEANVKETSLNTDSEECLPVVQMCQNEVAEVNSSITESSVEIELNQSKGALENAVILATPETEVTIEKEAKKDKLDSRSKHKLADSSSKSSKKSNMSKLSSSLARLATPVRPKKEASGSHKSAKELVEKKISTPKLVQMSINVNSDAKLIKKSSPISRKTGIGKVFTPLGKIIRESFVHTPAPRTPAPSTSRASVNSSSRQPSATPQTETRRSRIALEKSFARNRTSENILQSPSVGNMKSPAQSSITFSPFSFRTEERAAKRREFFERRLEREAENLQLLDKAKVKPKANFRKLSHTMNFSNAAVDMKREVLSDKTKIPLARPQPPKCTSKPSTNLAGGRCSQPHQGSVGSTPASGTNKSIPVTLSTKKRHENASPNIL